MTLISHLRSILTTCKPIPRVPPVIKATFPDDRGKSTKDCLIIMFIYVLVCKTCLVLSFH